MKKLLAVLLAALMIFSITTVAFAEGDETPAAGGDTSVVDPANEGDDDAADEDSFDIMDLPLWTVFAGIKGGKILLKIVKAFLKVAVALGLVDLSELLSGVIDSISGNADNTDAPADDVPAADTPADPVPAAA